MREWIDLQASQALMALMGTVLEKDNGHHILQDIYDKAEVRMIATKPINWLSKTATYYYDAAGRLSQIQNFNATVTDYGYDAANRLILLENRKSGGAIISSYQFPILDGNGNRVQEVREEPIPPSDLKTENVSFIYNSKRNRLQSAGSDTFSYDDEGRLSSKSGTSYTFDYAHRLTGIGGTDQFFYDGVGNRLKATRNGTITKYVYDAAGNLLAEGDSAGNITKYYIHGAGLLAMVTPAGQVYCYHYDPTGNTIALTDSSESMVNKYAYTPYGMIVNEVEAVQQPFKFVGQYGVMTEDNGFYYMRARYYDPEVGRFVSEDPSGFDGGDVNLYAYVGGNPILLNDPWGLYWFRQDWQTPGFVGRQDTPVPPGGLVSEFIEKYVPAGYTFGEMHDSFVGAATDAGIPDWLINFPSMIPMYPIAIGTEVLRTVGVLDQPVPPTQSTTSVPPTQSTTSVLPTQPTTWK